MFWYKYQSCYYSSVKILFLFYSKLCKKNFVNIYLKVYDYYVAQNFVKKTSFTRIWKYMATKHFITPEPKNKFANWFLTVLTMPLDNKTIS